ncbi:MAG: LysR family transcriptional regulator [Hyphomicrobiales bacterium]
MIGWDHWHTLLAVSRHGSYARAAKALLVDATTVGRRIKMLEGELGYELFVRDEGGLHPTTHCQSLLGHVETADDALRGAQQMSASAETGSVWREMRMTAPPFLITNLFAPALGDLVERRRLQVELIATASKAMLSRREADIAIRIEDRPQDFKIDHERIDAARIGVLRYAVYAPHVADPEALPWAGLLERYVPTTGTKAMRELADSGGFRYQAHHFETLREIAAAGCARTVLPDVMGGADERLSRVTGTVVEQPLWMLFHRQDRDVAHLRAARAWIAELAEDKLGPTP